MPYARNNYTAADVMLAFREIDTNLTRGAQWDPNTGMLRSGSAYGMNKKTGLPNFDLQPTPHPSIHGADELHSHPLFARARISTGDATTHSVMDQGLMIAALVNALNDPAMTPFLAQLDGAQDSVNVNVNYVVSPGNCRVYSNKQTFKQNANPAPVPVMAMSLKLRKNPGNANVPIIQTAIPHTAPLQVKTKKGAILGITI